MPLKQEINTKAVTWRFFLQETLAELFFLFAALGVGGKLKKECKRLPPQESVIWNPCK